MCISKGRKKIQKLLGSSSDLSASFRRAGVSSGSATYPLGSQKSQSPVNNAKAPA